MIARSRSLYHPALGLQRLAENSPERRARIASRCAKPPTRVPCPVCTEGQERIYYYPKGECCDSCLMELWQAQDEKAAAKARAEASETEILAVQPSWPYFMTPRGDRATTDAVKTLSRQFKEMLRVLTLDRVEPKRDYVPGRRIKMRSSSIYSEGRDAMVINVPDGAGDHIDEIADTVTECLRVIYEAGVDAGSGLIQRLASGEITIDTFDSRDRPRR